jgi:anti-sigma regulatory factor (Ser/Thr protein kinase)
MKKLTINASTDNLPAVLEFIDAELEAAGIGGKTQFQIDIAVEEIYVNIAHYAYAPDTGSATIQFDIRGNPPEAEIQFIDEGKPYNPLCSAEPDITLSAGEREIGGLGIFMTRKSMDAVEYRFEGNKNILTIRKYLGKNG